MSVLQLLFRRLNMLAMERDLSVCFSVLLFSQWHLTLISTKESSAHCYSVPSTLLLCFISCKYTIFYRNILTCNLSKPLDNTAAESYFNHQTLELKSYSWPALPTIIIWTKRFKLNKYMQWWNFSSHNLRNEDFGSKYTTHSVSFPYEVPQATLSE